MKKNAAQHLVLLSQAHNHFNSRNCLNDTAKAVKEYCMSGSEEYNTAYTEAIDMQVYVA